MIRILIAVALWLSAPILILAGANLYDPYLTPIRGWGDLGLFGGELVGIGVLAGCGYGRRGVAARLLLLLWCVAPLAMMSAVTVFQLRKHAVLAAEGPRARELGRHFIVGYASLAEIAPLAAKGLIAGIYVTRHNIEGRTADALKTEIANLQAIRSAHGLAPLIVAADQEGGIVSHLSPPLTALPALSTLAALPPAERAKKAEEFGRMQGRELGGLGVTLNFSPVVDLLRPDAPNPLDFNSRISRRAISGDPEAVADVATAYARGLEESGVEATAKHFPGLGRVRQDTHHFRADLATPAADLEGSDWLPFRRLLTHSSAYLMVGHVAVTAIDPSHAASHSKPVIDGLIRQHWGFDGIVITDDLVMGPIYEHGVCRSVIEALNAGADLLLIAYDGLQFYRIYHCALGASADGTLDEAMLASSRERLNRTTSAATIDASLAAQPSR